MFCPYLKSDWLVCSVGIDSKNRRPQFWESMPIENKKPILRKKGELLQSIFQSSEQRCKKAFQFFCAGYSFEAVFYNAVFFDDKSGHYANLILVCKSRFLIYVNHADVCFFFEFFCEFVDYRTLDSARTAPRCKEVIKNWFGHI